MCQSSFDKLLQTIDDVTEFIDELQEHGAFELQDYNYIIDLLLCVTDAAYAHDNAGRVIPDGNTH